MKFENLMYLDKCIKVVVDLNDVFIENNNDDVNYVCDESDTLDLTNVTSEINLEKEDSNV